MTQAEIESWMNHAEAG